MNAKCEFELVVLQWFLFACYKAGAIKSLERQKSRRLKDVFLFVYFRFVKFT